MPRWRKIKEKPSNFKGYKKAPTTKGQTPTAKRPGTMDKNPKNERTQGIKNSGITRAK